MQDRLPFFTYVCLFWYSTSMLSCSMTACRFLTAWIDQSYPLSISLIFKPPQEYTYQGFKQNNINNNDSSNDVVNDNNYLSYVVYA